MSTALCPVNGYISQQPVGDVLLLQGDINVDTYIVTATADLILQPFAGNALRANEDGDPRGAYAVDFQQERSNSDEVASGDYSVIAGGIDNESSATEVVIGGGHGNSVEGVQSVIIGGELNTIIGEGNFIGGGLGNDIDGNWCVLVGGDNCSIEGAVEYSFVGGGYTTKCLSNYATLFGGNATIIGDTSDYATVVGGQYSYINYYTGPTSCAYSFVGSGYLNRILGSEYSTILGGKQCNTQDNDKSHKTAIGGQYSDLRGSHSFVGSGLWNDSNGDYSISNGGRFMVVNGDYAVGLSGRNSTGDGDYSLICGNALSSPLYGQVSQASGSTSVGSPFGIIRGFQTSTLVARNQTTNDSDTVLYLDGSSETLNLDKNSTWVFKISVSAHRDTAGESAAWQIDGVIRKKALDDDPVIIGTPIKTSLGSDDGTWDSNVRVDTTNDALEIYVNGATGKNINWVARIELTMAIPYTLKRLIDSFNKSLSL